MNRASVHDQCNDGALTKYGLRWLN